jgi:hypothetical protein
MRTVAWALCVWAYTEESQKHPSLPDFLIPDFKNTCTLQRQNAENFKQIFPEKEYRGLSPNFQIHVSVSDLYIPMMELPFCWRKYVNRSWEYINRSQTHECGNCG